MILLAPWRCLHRDRAQHAAVNVFASFVHESLPFQDLPSVDAVAIRRGDGGLPRCRRPHQPHQISSSLYDDFLWSCAGADDRDEGSLLHLPHLDVSIIHHPAPSTLSQQTISCLDPARFRPSICLC